MNIADNSHRIRLEICFIEFIEYLQRHLFRELTVRHRLLIRATDRVGGTVRYGEIEIEPGGQLTGSVLVVAGPG